MAGESARPHGMKCRFKPLLCSGILIAGLANYAVSENLHDSEDRGPRNKESIPKQNDYCQIHANAVREGQELFVELSDAMPKFVGIASAGFHVASGTDVHEPPDSDCSDSAEIDSCWISIHGDSLGPIGRYSNTTGASLSFEGQYGCVNQRLTGSGTATWRWVTRWDLRIARGEGKWHNGRQQGRWVYQLFSVPCIGFTDSECRLSEENIVALEEFEVGPPFQQHKVSTFEGRYRQGIQGGLWFANFNNRDSASIPYIDGKKHGSQTYTKTTFVNAQISQLSDHYEIPWIKGKKDGHQVKTSWNGDREEIHWLNGKKHGEYIYSWSTGERETVPWIDGRQHGTSVITWPDGSHLTTLYEEGKKIGYETMNLLPQLGPDVVSLRAKDIEKKLKNGEVHTIRGDRTIRRKIHGVQHGLSMFYTEWGLRAYLFYQQGKWNGTHAIDRGYGRFEGLRVEGELYGVSVFQANDGYRRETPGEGYWPHGLVVETMANGNYRSLLGHVERKGMHGPSTRCWYDDIPWANDEMQGLEVFTWPDGGTAIGTWKYVSWHGPISTERPNGLCLETIYANGRKTGIEIQTQTNGYTAHIPVRHRWVDGNIVVYRPDGSRREIPYDSGKRHGVVYDIYANGDKVPVEEYENGAPVLP